MLEDYTGIRCVVLACGIDLRKGIDGLAMLIGDKYKQNPFEKDTLFLFGGRHSDRIKGLLWRGTGFLLLYMCLENGALSWSRRAAEAAISRRTASPFPNRRSPTGQCGLRSGICRRPIKP
ncbi:MAG: IS66 family insertion sequence element accessory protein TnpB [Butyrivibrio sp.]|nr:IS66 family insertion sequence element accessory protein TnpB [Acetatifactor muris]MCM1558282.1 IS66 family insertion sequence element accessory protein TnpB [Butyrivibrio sp.]